MSYSLGKKILWYASIIILLAGIIHLWLPGTSKEFFLTYKISYYIVNNLHLTIFLSGLNLALGSGYFLLQDQKIKNAPLISSVHIIITILTSLGSWIMGFLLNKSSLEYLSLYSNIFLLFITTLLIAQLLYFFSLIKILAGK